MTYKRHTLTKDSGLQPASFITWAKYNNGVELVTKLIKDSIEARQPIQKENILDCYWAFKSGSGRRTVMIHVYDRKKGMWRWKEATRANFTEGISVEENAINWFKRNLGNAVIHGRLLVIPVIDI